MNAVSSVPPDGLVLCPRQYGALTGSHICGVNDILLPFVSGSTFSTSSQSCAWAQNGNISLSILLAPWARSQKLDTFLPSPESFECLYFCSVFLAIGFQFLV